MSMKAQAQHQLPRTRAFTPAESGHSWAWLAFVCLGLLALSPYPCAFAIMADPKPIQFTQPDGSSVMLHLRGDEFFHWEEDTNGFTVLRVGGQAVYARLDA